MQFIGRLSLAPGVSVHDPLVALHFTAATSAAVFAARFVFQAASQPPWPAMPLSVRAPAPVDGGFACTPMPALTNCRNRPTVTSYVSNRKSLTVAGFVMSVYWLSVPTS